MGKIEGEDGSLLGMQGRAIQGDLAHKNSSLSPQDHNRFLGIGLLKGPRGGGGAYERGTPVLHCVIAGVRAARVASDP